MLVALAGLLAGIIHVWSGPDHLAAIAPLAVRRPKRAWTPGIRWGLGHSAGVMVVGLGSLWLRQVINSAQLSSWGSQVSAWGERLVGVVLVAIGFWGLRKAFGVHAHEHEHDGTRHVHMHTHQPHTEHRQPEAHAHHTHAAFGIGMLHGLAGSSHFLGVLPVLMLPTASQAVTYLAAFGIGTVASMAAFSWFIGHLTLRFAIGSDKLYRRLMVCCALAAMSVGAFWLVHVQSPEPVRPASTWHSDR